MHWYTNMWGEGEEMYPNTSTGNYTHGEMSSPPLFLDVRLIPL